MPRPLRKALRPAHLMQALTSSSSSSSSSTSSPIEKKDKKRRQRKRQRDAERALDEATTVAAATNHEPQRGAVLSAHEIRQAHASGDIVIVPFNPERIKPNSYDISLGQYFYRERKRSPKTPHQHPHNPFAGNTSMWKDEYEEALPFFDYLLAYQKGALCDLKYQANGVWDVFVFLVMRMIQQHYGGIDFEDRVIVLRPCETILCHTEEFIGGARNVTTMMKTRSSYGRNNIGICKCAGWGDVGYINRWTLEITNFSHQHPTILVVGRAVGQIAFLQTHASGDDDAYKGKYQNPNSDLVDIRGAWRPQQMLPRLNEDPESAPPHQYPMSEFWQAQLRQACREHWVQFE